ncbi:MAG TPA: 3-hydroxybenzoate 6-monooxygenase [Rhizomicrobium sp.]|nr:3-hydroxybenzoate 6-monooxygenase [Rhizomicrobium sp.]
MAADRVIIAGGGIGGLSAALALAGNGFKVAVLEKSPALGEIGAGIQLGPNAFHCFDRLGLAEKAREHAVFIDALRLMDSITAEKIAEIPLGDAFRARFGNPYAVVHRGELHKIMLRTCQAHADIELHVDSEVIDFEQHPDGVEAVLRSGEHVRGAALIGADGLWSNIRRKLVGDGAPRVSGHSTYRSVIPLDRMPESLRWNAATLWAGPKHHVVHYPLSGWKSFNLVVTFHNAAPAPVAGMPVPVEEVRAGFARAHPTVREIIACGSDWKLWVLCDRDPVERWVDGRVALLGDAAHPMLQYFAQGACMAMEDAVVLGETLRARSDDLPQALSDYNVRRLLRTARVQLQSREIGTHIYHPEGAHARLRNDLMANKSAEDWYDALQWLYGGFPSAATGQKVGQTDV